MTGTPPPPRLPGREPEPHEWTDAAMTFVPAIVVAVVARYALLALTAFSERRALFASIGLGIAVGVVLERVIDRRRGRR